MVHREFHIDDSVMFDSLRLMPVSRAQMKRWTKIRMGVAVLQPGTRRKDELHAQELDLRSLEECGGKVLLNDPDALVGPILFAIDEKLIVTFELFRRIYNINSPFIAPCLGEFKEKNMCVHGSGARPQARIWIVLRSSRLGLSCARCLRFTRADIACSRPAGEAPTGPVCSLLPGRGCHPPLHDFRWLRAAQV